MIVTRRSSAAPHDSSRIRSYPGAATTGCHAPAIRHGRPRPSGAPVGLPLRAHGRSPADVEPAGKDLTALSPTFRR